MINYCFELKNQEVVQKLKIKASRQEINLIHRSLMKKKKQISAQLLNY